MKTVLCTEAIEVVYTLQAETNSINFRLSFIYLILTIPNHSKLIFKPHPPPNPNIIGKLTVQSLSHTFIHNLKRPRILPIQKTKHDHRSFFIEHKHINTAF